MSISHYCYCFLNKKMLKAPTEIMKRIQRIILKGIEITPIGFIFIIEDQYENSIGKILI
jgi:hypothetical protein